MRRLTSSSTTVWPPKLEGRHLTDAVRYSGGLELSVPVKLNRDLEETDQVLHAQTVFVRADTRKTLRMAQFARSRVLRNPTVGQFVRYFRRSKGGVGGDRDRGLGGKMVLLGPAREKAVEQPTEESQVAACCVVGPWRFLDQGNSGECGRLFITGYLIDRSCQSRFCVTLVFHFMASGPTNSEKN